MDEGLFTVKQASDRVGVPVWVMRRMCRRGLIPYVRRSRVGYQMLTMEQVDLAKTLVALEKAGMPRKSLKRFSELFRQGDRTLLERKAMLETQKRQFWQELEELQRGIDVIERQVELIDKELQS